MGRYLRHVRSRPEEQKSGTGADICDESSRQAILSKHMAAMAEALKREIQDDPRNVNMLIPAKERAITGLYLFLIITCEI